jgi:tRNA pseudouridine13 synthase
MVPDWPRAGGDPAGGARLRDAPEDFEVTELLGFAPAGEGEHAWLQLQKTGLTTHELQQRVARCAGVARRDVGFSGIKDSRAVTRQWFSVWLPGRADPHWEGLAGEGDVQVLAVARHLRKLKRGVHRGNRFRLVLREVTAKRSELERRLQRVRLQGFPNYFGEQRFGYRGSTLAQAQAWASAGGARVSRNRRSLYLSALRASLFNSVLAERVDSGDWNRLLAGDVCMLQGTRSVFAVSEPDAELRQRVLAGDLHPALPLWGRGERIGSGESDRRQTLRLAADAATCRFLEQAGMTLAYRPARALADDFCWQFCDDGVLRLEFVLGAGSYATALLREVLQTDEAVGDQGSGGSSEQR